LLYEAHKSRQEDFKPYDDCKDRENFEKKHIPANPERDIQSKDFKERMRINRQKLGRTKASLP